MRCEFGRIGRRLRRLERCRRVYVPRVRKRPAEPGAGVAMVAGRAAGSRSVPAPQRHAASVAMREATTDGRTSEVTAAGGPLAGVDHRTARSAVGGVRRCGNGKRGQPDRGLQCRRGVLPAGSHCGQSHCCRAESDPDVHPRSSPAPDLRPLFIQVSYRRAGIRRGRTTPITIGSARARGTRVRQISSRDESRDDIPDELSNSGFRRSEVDATPRHGSSRGVPAGWFVPRENSRKTMNYFEDRLV
jgi:hypothetical protein